MQKKTYLRLKDDFPVIFSATLVALLASTFYNKPPSQLFSYETLNLFIGLTVWVLISLAVVYFVLWIIHKLFE